VEAAGVRVGGAKTAVGGRVVSTVGEADGVGGVGGGSTVVAGEATGEAEVGAGILGQQAIPGCRQRPSATCCITRSIMSKLSWRPRSCLPFGSAWVRG